MRYQRFGNRFQARLESGEEVISSLTRLAELEDFGFAALSGLGAVSTATVAYYNVDTNEYEQHQLDEQMEVTSLVGNVARKEDAPFPHVHATFGRRDLSTVGGHVFRAIAHSTIEIWLSTETDQIVRLPDEETGLTLLELSESL